MQPNAPQGMPTNSQAFQPQTQAQLKPKKPLGLIIALIILSLMLIASLFFAFWAFGERNTFKNKTDEIVAKEVALTEQRVSTEKDKEFTEKEKSPNKTYTGPSTFASVSFSYPKTWAGYVDESGDSATPVDGYFHPNFVPAIDSGTAFALRMEVVAKSYDSELKQFDGEVKSGKVKITPYRAVGVPDVLGARVEGEINKGQKVLMVLFPARDKTIKISTQAESFYKDFNETILKTLTFEP